MPLPFATEDSLFMQIHLIKYDTETSLKYYASSHFFANILGMSETFIESIRLHVDRKLIKYILKTRTEDKTSMRNLTGCI